MRLLATALSSRASRSGAKPASPGEIGCNPAVPADNDLGQYAMTVAPAPNSTWRRLVFLVFTGRHLSRGSVPPYRYDQRTRPTPMQLRDACRREHSDRLRHRAEAELSRWLRFRSSCGVRCDSRPTSAAWR